VITMESQLQEKGEEWAIEQLNVWFPTQNSTEIFNQVQLYYDYMTSRFSNQSIDTGYCSFLILISIFFLK